jgi:hypothetical protein
MVITIQMRVALWTTVLALGLAALPTGAGASTSARPKPKPPTRAQIRSAVRRAERSTSLWTTVNICDSKTHPDQLGIRGQMPTLGFAAWLSMKIQLNYFSTTKQRFVPDSGAAEKLIRLGRLSTGLQQGGAEFSFEPHAGLFNATVQFIWRRSGKLIGQTTKTTTAGHPNADFGSPPHYSAQQCRIP